MRSLTAACIAAFFLLCYGAGAVADPAPAPSPSPSPSPPAFLGRTAAEIDQDEIVPARLTPAVRVAPADLQRSGSLRLGDALATLPGVSAVGQGSSVSDDLFLSLHGFKPSEAVTLLDGHPIGLLGVSPDVAAGFDEQDSPLGSVRAATVSFGSGPSLGPYDGLVGSVALQTLDPSTLPQVTFTQALGSQARATSSLEATGHSGAVGYALAYGVAGTSGDFPPQTIAQTGLRATDFSSATLRMLTYPVSADAVLRNDFVKLTFPLGAAASATLTGLRTASWVDKTGVDDNDYYTVPFELAQAQKNLGGSLVAGGAACPPALVPVTDDGHPNPAAPQCITPAAYAAGASGPAGGGPGAFQTMARADEDLRIVVRAGNQRLTADGFADAGSSLVVRPASYVQGDAASTSTADQTGGAFLRDDVMLGMLTFGGGVAALRQSATSSGSVGGASLAAAGATLPETDAFAYASIAPWRSLTAAATVARKTFPGLGQGGFDPQFSLVYRAGEGDAFRLLAGASTSPPSALARGGAPALGQAGDLDPGNCTTFDIGTAPNAAVRPEYATDLEASYGHRFGSRASAGVSAYVTSVRDAIFAAATPLDAVGGLAPAALAGFEDRIRAVCPAAYGAASAAQIDAALTLEQPINAARALARGATLHGSYAVSRTLTLSGTYTIDSTRRFGLPDAVLAVPSNAEIVDGGQVANVPVHQGSARAAYAAPGGWEAAIDGHYEGPNNRYNMTGFAYADASVGIPAGHGRRFVVAAQNVFNSHADVYGRVGAGLFVPENPFGPDGTAIQQATERYGLVPVTITVTLTQIVGR